MCSMLSIPFAFRSSCSDVFMCVMLLCLSFFLLCCYFVMSSFPSFSLSVFRSLCLCFPSLCSSFVLSVCLSLFRAFVLSFCLSVCSFCLSLCMYFCRDFGTV